MAKSKTQVVLALDSGVLIASEKDHRVEAVIRKWLTEGASVLIPAPAIAEVIRGDARDARANRMIKMVGFVAPTAESAARDAGVRIGKRKDVTLDAMIVATAEEGGATDILTTDPADIALLASSGVNVIPL